MCLLAAALPRMPRWKGTIDVSLYMQITIALAAILILSDLIMRKVVSNRITRYFSMGKYEELLAYLDTFTAKNFMHPFNIEYVRMNAYLALGQDDKAIEVVDKLLAAKLDKRQQPAVVDSAFTLYLDAGRYKDAKKMLAIIEKEGQKDYAESCREMYEIIANKSSRYLDEMLEELPEATGEAKAQLLSLIALQYRNRGQQAKYRMYTKQLEDMAKGGSQQAKAADAKGPRNN